MLDFFLGFGSLLFSAYDTWFTHRRIQKYGISVEFNPVIALLSAAAGLDFAVFAACIVPTAILVGLGVHFNANLALAWFLGVKTCVWRYQRMSLKIERMVEESRPPDIGT